MVTLWSKTFLTGGVVGPFLVSRVSLAFGFSRLSGILVVTVIYCLPLLLSRDHHMLLNLAQVPSIGFLNTHSLSWFKMNGTPPSLEEKVRHCGEEQEYRDRLSARCHLRRPKSLNDWADDVRKQEDDRNGDDVG